METENTHNAILEILAKYFANEASPDETRLLENWLRESGENEVIFVQYRQAWDYAENFSMEKAIDLDAEWSKLDEKISRGKSRSLKPVKAKTKTILGPFFRYAAIFILVLMSAGLVYYLSGPAQTQKLMAESRQVEKELPDGSRVTLNSHSILKYKKSYNQQKREVSLRGEAFFEVEPNPTIPFIVDAGPVFVEVLGTSFYVNNREDKEEVEVIVKTGQVAVIPKHTDERVLLQPGEKGVFRKETRKLEKLENKDVNFIAWKTKKIIFKGDSFRYIAEQIEKVYNVKVIIRSEALEKCRITTSFNQLPLPAVLNVLTSMLDIRVQQEENTIIITGKGC